MYNVISKKITSAEEIVTENTVRLSPNPTSNGAYLDFDLANASDVTISLLDVQGRQIATQRDQLAEGAQRSFLSTQGLPAGSYVVRLVAGDQVVSKLLMVGGE